MRALAVILLAYIILMVLFTKFLPLPFIGHVAGLLIYPFARMVSWKELFKIYFFWLIFFYCLNPESVIGAFQMILPYAHGYELILPLTFPFIVISSAVLDTAIMKVIGVRFKPKMLKRLMA